MKEGTVPVPHTAPALSGMMMPPVQLMRYLFRIEIYGPSVELPVQELYSFYGSYRILGGAGAAGVNPVSVHVYLCTFPVKIVLFSYDAEIVTPLSIRYDECRRPRWDAPAADR